MISSDRFFPSKGDQGMGCCPRLGRDHIQNSHVFILPLATILKRLNSVLDRSLAQGQPPFVNTVYIMVNFCAWAFGLCSLYRFSPVRTPC